VSLPNWTHEQMNQGYMDGVLPSSDARLVLLGYEGSGKTCLADTLVGKSFQEDTAPTEGADRFEIGVTTAANWELMDDSDKILNLEKQTFLETEFFLSSKNDQVVAKTTPLVPSPIKNTQPVAKEKVKHDGVLSMISAFFKWGSSPQSEKKLQSPKKFTPISTEEFQQLKALQEQYDPEKKYIHLWDFAGQQVNIVIYTVVLHMLNVTVNSEMSLIDV